MTSEDQSRPARTSGARIGAGLFSSSLGVAVLYLAARGAGFLRDPVIAGLYGASAHSDSYYIALSISYLAYAVALGGLAASVVPVLVSRRVRAGDASAWTFLGAYLFWIAVLFLAVGWGLFAWPDAIISILSPGLAAPARALAVRMLQVLALVPLLTAISTTLASALNCYDRFLLPALLPLGGNLLSIALLVSLTRPLGVIGAAWAFVAGAAVQAASLGLVAWRQARLFRPRFVVLDSDLGKAIRLALPGFLSEGLINVNFLFILYLATSLGAGVFSSIQYSTKVQQVFVDVFIAAVGVVMFPHLARSAVGDDRTHLSKLHSLNLVVVTLVLVPITALVVLLRTEVIQILYERHAFDAEATRRTATVLGFGVLSLVPAGIKDAAVRTFYALHDSVTPLLVIAPAVVVNVALNFVLVKPFGGAGLMLAYSLATALLAATLLVVLARRGVLRLDGELRRSIMNIAGATATMSLAVWGMRLGLESRPRDSWFATVAQLAGCVAVGGALYAGSLFVLREREVEGLRAPLVIRLRALRARFLRAR